MADRTVSVALIARVQGYVAGIATAKKATLEFGGELEQMRKRNSAGLRDMEMAAGAAGAAMLAMAGWAVKSAMAFDKQMSAVGAVANASAGELDQLRQAALAAGKATVFSATEAAKAEEELAKAGLSAAQITGGALAGSLNLAAAGSIDLAEASDIAAKSMNIFQLGAGQVGHIADVLSASANKSATDVHEMGEALRMGGLAAKTANFTLEDTVGVLSAFADRALVGSDAGTSLKTMLSMLSNPTAEATAKMRELGIEVYDSSGQFVGAERLAGILQQRLSGLTQQQRQSALQTIFGSDATRAATVLYELGTEGIHKYISAVDDSGAAARAAAAKTDNLAGDIERLKGNIESLTIASGEGANGGLRSLVSGLDHFVTAISGLPAGVQESIVVLSGLSGGALLAAAGFLKVRGTIQDAMDAMREAGPVGTKFAGGLGRVAAFATKLTLGLAALQIASAAIGSDVNPQIDDLVDRLTMFGKVSGEVRDGANIINDGFDHLAYDLSTLDSGAGSDFLNGTAKTVEGLTGLGAVFDESMQHAAERLGGIDAALAQMVQSGHAQDAEAAFRRLTAEAAKQGVSVNELSKGLPAYTAAVDQMAKATDFAGSSAAATAANTETLAGSLEDAVKQAGSLSAVWDALTGKMRTSDETLLAAEESLDDITQSFKTNGNAIEGNSLAALRNRVVMEKNAKLVVDAAQAYLDQTGDIKGASAMLKTYEDAAIKSSGATGKARDRVKEFADQLYRLPASKSVTIDVKTRYTGAPGDPLGYAAYYAHAQGALVDYYAGGGVRENHVAQIGGVGTTRIWNEPETGGEAYIPLAASKRGRSTEILRETNLRLGSPLGGSQGPISVAAPDVQVAVYMGDREIKDVVVRVIKSAPETVALANREGQKMLAYS